MVGIILVSALLILPAVTALQVAKGFKTAMIIASTVSVISILLGITTSFFLDLPTRATIVIINALFFGLAIIYKKI